MQQHAGLLHGRAHLKTSVHNLGTVDVAKNGLGSLQTALSSVQTNAETLATEAKSAFPSQTTALNKAVPGLETTIKSAQGQPVATAAAAIVPAVAQVKTSANELQGAVSGKCHEPVPGGCAEARTGGE